jgi:hypothetical protein
MGGAEMGLVDKAKDAAKTAAGAAQKGLDDVKGAGNLYSLRRQVGTLTDQLGQVVFRQHEGEAGLESEVDRLVEEIRSVKAEIDSLEQE